MGFHHIVVAVDGSEASQEALNQAVSIARQDHAGLTGIFVLDSGWPDYIGNDWQSSRNSRQGFLDYVYAEQKQQAAAAADQFESAAGTAERAQFVVIPGNPAEVLIDQLNNGDTDLLVLGRRTFQVSGRPSLKALAKRITRKAQVPVMLFP
jgi:nucleotide-binding universal stress UspA family protein